MVLRSLRPSSSLRCRSGRTERRRTRAIMPTEAHHSKPAPEEFFGESHMTPKDLNELRLAVRGIRGAFKNLRMRESLGEPAQTHWSSPKHRRMRAFFVVGWAAGTIAFVLLFLR